MKYENRNKGFTLIEMIVVLMIIVIVSAVGTVGMLHYLDYSMFNQNEEYARTIFSTTQTALTNLKKSGGLEELQEYLKSHLYENSTVISDGEDNWYDNDSDKTVSDTDDSPRYYYLNSYYYDSPPSGGEPETISDKVTKPKLKELIGDYIYDNDIWNHALSVEIDPYDGVVRRVWYCKQTMEFSRTDPNDLGVDDGQGNNDGTIRMYIGHGTSTISYEDRREKKIGLYSAEVDTMPEDKLNLPTPAQNVLFENGDRLLLKWNIDTSKDYDYIVELNDNSGHKAELTIPKETIADLNGDPSYKSRKVRLKDGSERYFLMYRADKSVELSLDAIDYSVKVLGDGTDENPGGEYTGSDLNHFTTSAMRFTLSEYGGLKISDKIHARIYSYDGTNKSEPADSENDDYLLFDASSSTHDYKISNFRHLHNVRFAKNADMGKSTYTITKSLDWNTSSKLIYDSTGSNDTPLDISGIKYKPTVVWDEQTLDGRSPSGDITISNIVAGDYGETDIGLVKQNNGIIQNILLSNPTIRGGQHVGAFCGVNAGDLINLSVSGGDIIGNDSVGGIVGSSGSVSKSLTLEGLNNSTPVSGVMNVGGIVGHASNGSISASHNYGTVKFVDNPSDTSKLMYLGGVAGLSENIVFTNCSSEADNPNDVQSMLHSIVTINSDGTLTTNSVPSQLTSLLNGSFVGGFAGKAVDSTIKKGNIVKTNYILGKRFVGGIVGQFSKSPVAENAEMQGLENNATVIGHYCVGGITGSNGTIDDEGAGKIDPALNGDDKCKISYCNNFGLVSLAGNPSMGDGNFCGGITGFNNGVVKACVTDNSALMYNNMGYYYLEIIRKLSEAMCKYSGGLIGYNNHKLDNTEFNKNSLSGGADINPYVNPIISSANSTGGVVGYVGSKSNAIKNIDVKGGYIFSSNGAGGFIGTVDAKDCINMQEGDSMVCLPNYVNGTSNVGGFIGIANTDSIKNIYKLTLGNGSTIVRCGDYVGGLIGTCSSSVSLEQLNVNIAEITTSTNATGGLIGTFSGKNFSMRDCYYVHISDVNGYGTMPNNATGGIIGYGSANNDNFTFSNVNVYIDSITSQNYLGGVIGYDNMSSTGKHTINNFNCQVYGSSNNTDVGRFIGYKNYKPSSAIDFSGFNFNGNITSPSGSVTKNIGNQ